MDPARGPIAGRYRLEEVIGRGGMSTVYRASDSVLGRTVAVKVMLAGLADEDPAYVARFEREARATAALRNPAVVAVYDVGVDGDVRFIVMEHVAGRSLATLLRGGTPLAVDQAVQIGEQVAGALAAAHAVGIVHRDIKPANVMVADDGAIKVLDFGVARMLDGTTITQAASVLGTAAYMAPERAQGAPGDARSDIYSLGCLLYAMLTGGPPFRAEHAAAVLHQHVSARPRPLRTGVPAALDSLVGEMLAKAPEARPQGAREVRDRLAAAIDPTAPTVSLPRTSRPTKRRALAAALATAALALLVLLLASSGGGGSPGRAPAAARHTIPASTRSRSATQALRAAPKPAVTVPAVRAPSPKAPPKQDKRPPRHGKGHGGEHHGHGHGGGGGN